MKHTTKNRAQIDLKAIERALSSFISLQFGAIKVYNSVYQNEDYSAFIEYVKQQYNIVCDEPFESLSTEMKRSVMRMLKTAVSLYIESLESEKIEQSLFGGVCVDDVKNTQEEYYYCTKKIKFPKKTILRHIYNFFENNNDAAAPFNEVYAYLQSVLQVTSVNKQHLRDFLQIYTDKVSRNKIIAMLEEYESGRGAKRVISLSSAVSLRLADAIEVLGLDFLKSYLPSDGNAVHKFLQAFHPCRNIDCQLKIDMDLRDYILSFSETELVSLLRENPDIFCSRFSEFKATKKEERQIEEYISQIRNLINQIPFDNHSLKLSYLLKPSVAAILLF